MIRKLFIGALILAVVGLGAFWFLTIPGTIEASALSAHAPNLDNGRIMFLAGGCGSCHAIPNQKDKTRLGGGLALKAPPFGTFYVPNISPDRDGIGAWSEAQFVTAMKKGTSPDGRHYFPVFPYPAYTHMTVGDLRDLFAYLKTLPPLEGRAREHEVPFPFNIRRIIGGWKLLFFEDRTFTPDATRSAAWNRGAYLVNGPGHCAECHSPRNILGGIKRGQRFAGGPNPEGADKKWVPNITQSGLKNWSEEEIADLLNGVFFGSSQMADVVGNTTQLSPEDRAAMATYVNSLPAVEGPTNPKRQ